MNNVLNILLLLSALMIATTTRAFITPRPQSITTQLSAKKKKQRSGEGFGKQLTKETSSSSFSDEGSSISSATALQSIDATPQQQSQSSPAESLNLDPNLSPEERSQEILRQKFGLKSYEEQQADLGDYRALLDSENKKEKRTALRNLDKVWPENKNFVEILPPSVIKGIDSFLKLGLSVCTVIFVGAGVLITIEAGSKTNLYEIPKELEEFVVNVVQPNFTPGLGVLLAFSVTLGLFTVGLGSSGSSTYREDP